jgi:hypothetical protein
VTYAPPTYLDARAFLIAELDMHPGSAAYGEDLDPAEVGIVGSRAHVAAGTSYHLGADQLKRWLHPYSVELARDRRGLTHGAAALDIGQFRMTFANGRTVTHHDLGAWCVEQCQAGAPDAAWIREIIYSPDGRTVLRYDRERGQGSAPRAGEADDSHLTHDHLSGYRDAEHVDKTALFRRFLAEMGGDDMPSIEEILAADIDPGPGTHSLGGGVFTILGRTGYAVNEQIPALLAELRKGQADDAARDQLTLAAVQALAATGGPDAAPIVAEIRAARDQLAAGYAAQVAPLTRRVDELQARLAERDNDVDALRAKLAAAAQAQADALASDGPAAAGLS